MSADQSSFDPYAILAALDRRRVTYIVVGAFARVIQGAEEVTGGVDIVPSLREENLRRLGLALEDLGAETLDGTTLVVDEIESEPVLLRSPDGELRIVAEPVGTRGYDDLRRSATREPIGKGLRPSVASTRDLARMLAALDREEDRTRLQQLRRLGELERGLSRGIER